MSPRRSLPSFFRGTPRPGQLFFMERVEAGIVTHDVIVGRLPTGTGKQRCACAIMDWAAAKAGGGGLRSVYAVPNNPLLGQVMSERPDVPKLLGGHRYLCPRAGGDPCDQVRGRAGRYCLVPHIGGPAAYHHPDSCAKVRDLRRARGRGAAERKLVCVYHTLLGHKLAEDRDIVIYDEAHNLVKLRQEFAGFSLDMAAARVPDTVWTEDEFLEWCGERTGGGTSPLSEEVERIVDAVAAGSHILRLEDLEDARGRSRRVARAVPVDVSTRPPGGLWPAIGRGQKVILLTATLSDSDLRQLGLAGRKTLIVDVPSDIPPERRPIFREDVCRMTRGNEAYAIRELARWLGWALQEAWPGVRGVIHLPYRLGEMLRREAELAGGELARRTVYFTPKTRGAVLSQFLSGQHRSEVLIAAGCSEGLDLRDDLARFQVIGDTPQASLGDAAVRWLHANDPVRAEWETVKTLAQTYGRVSRHPLDDGETVMTDGAGFRYMDSSLMPQTAAEAYR